MDPILIVQPHMDDAVLSCGQFIAGYGSNVYVMTIFGGRPNIALTTLFDRNSGFLDSDEAIPARQHEDERAMFVLGAKQIRAAFLDYQYRVHDRNNEIVFDINPVVDAICEAIKTVGAVVLYGPVGIAHPDHEIVGSATILAARQSGVKTYLYEEIPNRVVSPELVVARFAETYSRYAFELEFVGTGPMEKKQQAIRCYKSQLWALDENVLYVPERFHRLEP